jgi:uncharacterized membrane protein YhaH (DUF805 family)
MKWFIHVINNYNVFSGRSRRAEYWYFTLVSTIISLITVVIDKALGTEVHYTIATQPGLEPIVMDYGYINIVYGLFVFLPSLAVSVRRMHDVGKSGWMLFINLIPILGWIYYIVLLCRDSEPGDNQYGPNPKGID